MRRIFLLAAFLYAVAATSAQPTQNTLIQPDCLVPFIVTAAGNSPTANVTNAQNDNRTRNCAAWTLHYQNTGMTGVTVTLQSGCSTSTTVSYGSFAGTISTGYVNGIVSDTGGSLQATNGTACISWVRVNVAATGTGTLTGVLYGFRNSSAAVNGAGGSNCPQGTMDGDIQIKSGAVCYGDSNFAYYPNGIPDPDAPAVSAIGVTDGTTYGYRLVLALGPAASQIQSWSFTDQSPEATVIGNSTLSGMNYNSITLPATTDPNISYQLARTTGPGSPQIIQIGQLLADGGTDVLDQSNGSADPTIVLSTQNNTQLSVIIGVWMIGQDPGAATFGASYLVWHDAFGNIQNGWAYDGVAGWSPRAFGSNPNPDWVTGGDAWNVVQVNTTGMGCGADIITCLATPYVMLRSDGFIRCDTTNGNISVTLPDPTASGFPLGRIFVIHKPAAANGCTINAGMGQTIDGVSTYVLTSQFDSVTVYYDGTSWATDNRLNFSKVLGVIANAQLPINPTFTTIQTTGSAFAGLGTPGNGTISYCSDCTVTSGIDNTCANSGTGAVAQRINGAWKCEQ